MWQGVQYVLSWKKNSTIINENILSLKIDTDLRSL
jgi:hypothetical protein